MQFEDFDKKIIDAAEHHHPAYEEKAWEKMETLLDKHMPVKKDDRRRIIFFLLLFLVLGSGAFLLFRGDGKTKAQLTTQPATGSKNVSGTPLTSEPKTNSASETKPEVNETDTKEVAAGVVNKNSNAEIIEKNTSVPATNDVTNSAASNTDKIKAKSIGIKETKPVFNSTEKTGKLSGKSKNNKTNDKKNLTTGSLGKEKTGGNTTMKSIAGENKQENGTVSSAEVVLNPAPVKEEVFQKGETSEAVKPTDTSSQKKSDASNIKPEVKNNVVVKNKTDKKSGKKQFPLAITFSAGPDLSFINVGKLGKGEMRYGAGLSYAYKRFTLRSGFYVSKKVYSADGYDYRPFYPNLEKVDGDCKVFEIPVSVNYNFIRRKNYNWFASTGLSSYLMKRETYDYLSKDPGTGMTNYWSRTWSDKNKHYFSVLNLSAGYERKFTNAVSVIAEPYLQIPLTGIGNGKMKLNSAGVLVTLSVKPFSKKK